MQVDREVTRAKYDQEVSVLRSRAGELARMGCYVVKAEFPIVEVIVAPTRPVVFSVAPLGQVSLLGPEAEAGQLQLQAYAVPPRFTFTLMAFGIRIGLDDFDLRAPSYTFRHPATWELMPVEHLPAAVIEFEGRDMAVMLGNHPITKAAFFCMRGVREYHEHPEHTGDEWLQYRKSINVFSTLSQIVRSSAKTRPILVIAPPQLAVRFGG